MKKATNLVECLGKGISFHENTTLNFNGAGMVLGVSLNIHEYLKDYLPTNRIRKGDKMTVYFLEHQIPSDKIDVFHVQRVHDYLMANAMANIREAKSAYFKREARKLLETCPKLS
ncbi:hypothetical protein EOM86_05640 [Candidatus Nomurabacteria bacterium]|nr:hypothetical protein [Candidatus Nomurabacteria bacterium]